MLSGTCVIECASTTLSIGDTVTATINGTTVFSGYCKKIERLRPDYIVRVSCNDILVRAVDYFMASDDPEKPFQRNNISSLSLVRDLLAEAGITNVTTTEPLPTFVWGTNPDGARFNLQSVADAVNFVAQITGNLIYYDRSLNEVQFRARKPYPDGDSPVATWTTGDSGNIISINYSVSSDKTRNVVQVYGLSPLTARASAANAYLVVDQAVVIAHELLDTQAICDGTASVNLTLLNRLERKAELELVGDASIAARSVYTITETFTGLSENAFAYRVGHLISESGFTTTVTATMA